MVLENLRKGRWVGAGGVQKAAARNKIIVFFLELLVLSSLSRPKRDTYARRVNDTISAVNSPTPGLSLSGIVGVLFPRLAELILLNSHQPEMNMFTNGIA